jgi:probable HAF family extracellular repeat protein
VRIIALCLGAIGLAGLAASLILVTSATATRAVETACSPSASILESPRVGSEEVQAKALNDRGDIVGFADSSDPKDKAIHAILWKNGKVGSAVDLGVLPGYVASEAYGVNNNRVVFGLLYDKKERTFPFRWEAGRMTVMKGPNGQRQEALFEQNGSHNRVNDRGEMAGTLVIAGQMRAVRWSPDGKASFLPGLPGDAWTVAKGIDSHGIVSGWSRRLPKEDDENNPVIWTMSGRAIAMKTAPGRADGAANATNRSGLTVGYLGNLGTDGIPGVANTDPERDNAVVWQTRTARPRQLGRPAPVHGYSELVDVNDRGQAAAVSGSFTKTGFPLFKPAIWRTGWTSLKPLPIPSASQKSRVVITDLNDINNRGDIVGNVYGLDAKDFSKLRRIDPVLWTCPFGR